MTLWPGRPGSGRPITATAMAAIIRLCGGKQGIPGSWRPSSSCRWKNRTASKIHRSCILIYLEAGLFALYLAITTLAFCGEMIIYQTPDGQTTIEVSLEKDTVWLDQYQLADLFQTDRTSLNRQIRNIYNSNELEEQATLSRGRVAQTRGQCLGGTNADDRGE